MWLALVAALVGYGLWRAARAARAGDALTGLTLTGLVGALISPITWTHHIYWLIPAVVALADAALDADPATPSGARRRRRLTVGALAVFAIIVYGVVSFYDWGVAPVPTDTPLEFLLRNTYVLLSLALLIFRPIRPRTATPLHKDASPA